MPESETDGRWRTWFKTRQIGAAEDSDHPRRMTESGDLGEEPRLHRLRALKTRDGALGIDEQLDRLEPGLEGRLDQVFTLTTEQTQALALTA